MMPNAIEEMIRMVSVLLCELAQEVTGSPMTLAVPTRARGNG